MIRMGEKKKSENTGFPPSWEWFKRKNIGAWLLDSRGHGELRDRSRNRNHGALSGTSIVSIGTPFGLGKDFSGNGNNDRYDLGSITSANPLSLVGSESHSIMWRARVNSGTLSSAFPRVIDKSNGGSAAQGWAIWFLTGSDLYEFAAASSNGSKTPVSSVIRDEWETWTVNQIGSGVVEESFSWYKNGIPMASSGTTIAPIASTTTNAAIGNWNHSTDRAFDGQMDFLYVFKPVLTVAEIRVLTIDPFGPFRMKAKPNYFVPAAAVGFVPYPNPRYAMTAGHQLMSGGMQ